MKTQLQKHTSVFAHCRSLFVFLAGLLTLISKTELQGGCCVDCDVVMYLAVIPFPIRRSIGYSMFCVGYGIYTRERSSRVYIS